METPKHTKTKINLFCLGVKLWWHLPLSRQSKERIKTIIFLSMPFLFKRTVTYKNWHYTMSMAKPDFNFDPADFPPQWSKQKITKKANQSESLQNPQDKNKPGSLAIIIHAFYKDLFLELLGYLNELKHIHFKLFISTTSEEFSSINAIADESGFDYHLDTFNNKGRDILPFLKLSDMAIKEGFSLLLKLHTKKSDHRLSGYLWRKELYNKLLKPSSLKNILNIFQNCPTVGLIGPSQHIVPMSLYYGANARSIGYLSYRMNIDAQTLKDLNFVAGSMFYIRTKSLQPLLELQLQDDMFENEAGQQDGTMAHAVERGISLSNYAAGFTIADTDCSIKNITPKITQNHQYTW